MSLPKNHPDWFWEPPSPASLLFNGYPEFFPGGTSAGPWCWPLNSSKFLNTLTVYKSTPCQMLWNLHQQHCEDLKPHTNYSVLTNITFGRSFCVSYNSFFFIFVVPCIMLYNCEISPTRCNNCVLFFSMALLYVFRATISPIISSTYAYMATGKLAHLGCKFVSSKVVLSFWSCR